MEIRVLRYFLTVVREENISKATQKFIEYMKNKLSHTT
jgi:hypothetical protein